MFDQTAFTNLIPPRIEDVRLYFEQKGMTELEAEAFFLFYDNRQWSSSRGLALQEWKGVARRWIAAIIHQNPAFYR